MTFHLSRKVFFLKVVETSFHHKNCINFLQSATRSSNKHSTIVIHQKPSYTCPTFMLLIIPLCILYPALGGSLFSLSLGYHRFTCVGAESLRAKEIYVLRLIIIDYTQNKTHTHTHNTKNGSTAFSPYCKQERRLVLNMKT